MPPSTNERILDFMTMIPRVCGYGPGGTGGTPRASADLLRRAGHLGEGLREAGILGRHRLRVLLSGPDEGHLLHGEDEHLPIPDLPRAGAGQDRADRALDEVLRDADLDPHLVLQLH